MSELLCWFEAHPGLSSWIQTIGSLIALFVAIWLPYRQGKAAQIELKRLADMEAVRQKTATLDHVEKLYAMGLHTFRSLHNFMKMGTQGSLEEIRDALKESYSPTSLKMLVDNLNSVPLFALPNGAFLSISLKLREACNICVENAQRYVSGVHNNSSMEVGSASANIDVAMATLEEQLELLMDVRMQLAKELGRY